MQKKPNRDVVLQIESTDSSFLLLCNGNTNDWIKEIYRKLARRFPFLSPYHPGAMTLLFLTSVCLFTAHLLLLLEQIIVGFYSAIFISIILTFAIYTSQVQRSVQPWILLLCYAFIQFEFACAGLTLSYLQPMKYGQLFSISFVYFANFLLLVKTALTFQKLASHRLEKVVNGYDQK